MMINSARLTVERPFAAPSHDRPVAGRTKSGGTDVHEIRGRLARLTTVDHVDPRTARQGRMVVSLLYALVAVAVCFLPFVPLLAAPGPIFLSVTTAIVAFVFIAAAVRRGHVLLGSVLTLLTYMIALMIGTLASGRIGSGPQFVVLAITMAGATLGVRHVLVALGGALTTLGALALFNAHTTQAPVSVDDVIVYATLMCAFTAVVSAVTAYAFRQTLLAEEDASDRANELSCELLEANRHLELRVAERTAELEAALRNQTALASSLAELSVRDPLTGLHNRRHLDAEMVRMFEAAVRHGRPIALALLDLDSFKTINDAYGHSCGDEVLRWVAQILVDCTRGADLVARYGGEELALVMPDTAMDAAAEACERIRRQIECAPWDEVRPGLAVTTSVGLADGHGHDTVWHLLREADKRLYAAKAAGRNRMVAELTTADPTGWLYPAGGASGA